MLRVTSAQHPNGDGPPAVTSIPLSAETDLAGSQSIGGLVRDATTHLSTLLRAEVELAKSEITGEVKKGLKGSVFFLVALTLALLALPFLLTAAALGINKGLWDWAQPWGGFLIIFIVMLVVAGACVFLGIRKVKKIRAPERTISSVRDTASALRRHGEPADPRLG
jgi:uncharacterized membrane protein YqjE